MEQALFKISTRIHMKVRGFIWSIISADSGDTIMLMSILSVSSGRLKTRVFPFPVPTSRITSCPHRIETQAQKNFCRVLQRNVEQGDHGQLHVVCTVELPHGEVLLSH